MTNRIDFLKAQIVVRWWRDSRKLAKLQGSER